jgi:GntR family transcriptional regulator
MEQEGTAHTLKGRGTFIREDYDMIRRFKNEMAEKALKAFVLEVEALGYNKEEIPSLIRDYLRNQ